MIRAITFQKNGVAAAALVAEVFNPARDQARERRLTGSERKHPAQSRSKISQSTIAASFTIS